jgi:uncharacterized protein (DUF4213/DUF364 family)
MENTIQQKIIENLKPLAGGLYVADVRIGLGYTSVRLDNGNTGLAWTAQSTSGSCTHLSKAGTLGGRPALELLDLLSDELNALSRTVGLATANALVAGLPRPQSKKEDVLDIVRVNNANHVVMVGFFGPLIPALKKTGCQLDILELNADLPDTISPKEGKDALAACDVAIITGTSVVTGTLDGLLAGLREPRAVVILGPSAIMFPPVYAGTPVTHIAGALINNAAAVEKIVSEGGGTMILKPYMSFETVCL